jgi:tetratricopeptide (TPR) repeat protein
MSRLPQLHKMLEKSPQDTFLLYAIALEHKKVNEYPQALDYLSRTLAVDPDHAYAYYQVGQTHEQAGEPDKARQAYQDGITAARRKGDAKALGELQTALDILG